ncbi:MAG: iron-only hydrogenase system regulator [Clostridia bacterium]|nr:iron-only hydrogenase system regulator [Clostridia bacterium]
MDHMAKIAVVAILIEDVSVSDQVNGLLHQYAEKIVGRMGIPYREKNVNIISVVMDATPDEINSLSGNLGRLSGVRVKVLTA